MKRYRHHNKGTAIVLACFGSVIEQQMYLDLKEEVASYFPEVDIYLSFSSRMVLKDLQRRQMPYKNLPQVLADVDMLGYKRIVVASINLFPTDEHELLKRTVKGFNHFSLANIRYTKAIINKTKESSLALKALNDAITQPNRANLYVIHGVPLLDLPGLHAVSYTESFLKMTGQHNYTCSLEGAFPYYAIKESLIAQMKADGITRVQVVPMLLVSGNHYRKDMVEITQELSEYFEANIVPSQSRSERFNLIELEDIRKIIMQNIEEEIVKLGC